MEFEPGLPKTAAQTRHQCAACFQQFKKKDHLIEHMKKSYHSMHQPKCNVCQKHCKSLESLREHISGPLAKAHCSAVFMEKGCNLCLRIFEGPSSLIDHKESCYLPAPAPYEIGNITDTEYETSNDGNCIANGLEAVAMHCEMVGGGSDGTLDLCARVCLINEEEELIFHTYVLPQIPVTNYRNEMTGITEEDLKDGMPLKQAQAQILQILYNGESVGRVRLDGGKAKVLVGHNLEQHLNCLRMYYPDKLLRETATYPPLLKTNSVSHSLQYLTKTYLGYDIRLGPRNILEDCISVMRLYKRMRSQEHQLEYNRKTGHPSYTLQSYASVFDSKTKTDLNEMSPEELFEMSQPNYRCWCLDSRPVSRTW